MTNITVNVTTNESTGEPGVYLQIDDAAYMMAVDAAVRLRDALSKAIADASGEPGPAFVQEPDVDPRPRLLERRQGPSLFHK